MKVVKVSFNCRFAWNAIVAQPMGEYADALFTDHCTALVSHFSSAQSSSSGVEPAVPRFGMRSPARGRRNVKIIEKAEETF
jgi:hypothetical protein